MISLPLIRAIFAIFIIVTMGSCSHAQKEKNRVAETSKNLEFNKEDDLLLLNYDCKTDVDDLHSVAAASSLLRIPQYSELNYHAVAGSYGVQGGKYVPANSLFRLAFRDAWSDAHMDFDQALHDVFLIVQTILNEGGDIWIAEAGQSDFSAALVMKIRNDMEHIDTNERIHIVQHSNWNEEQTTDKKLTFVKEHSHYQKIPDGNALNNGTPGFNTSDHIDYKSILDHEEMIAIWDLAITLANTYNGVDDRYLNKSIAAGGMDFSDFSEVHHILQLPRMKNCLDYFQFLERHK